MKPKIICVTGPTAAGKTELAVLLALRVKGEVVSADSMQIYRGMDIGTAKPGISERQGVTHHMIDICSPAEKYSVSRYVDEAGMCIGRIIQQGKTPIITGGTGLYIHALIDGLIFSGGEGDMHIRTDLSAYADAKGNEALHARLREIDPETAQRLHPNDRGRVIRAIELYLQSGLKMSEHIEKTRNAEARYDALMIGITRRERSELYTRIDGRVDNMLRRGLEEEVRSLAAIPGVRGCTAMQAIGYKELLRCIDGETTLSEAAEDIKRETRRYAKRQLTWFRRDKRIRWIEASEDSGAIQYADLAEEWAKEFFDHTACKGGNGE